MMIKNTGEYYGIVAQLLHWLMVVLLAAMVAIGFTMDSLHGPLKIQVIGIHKATGIVILFLAVLRLLWRSINKTPSLPASMAAYEKLGAHLVHWLLYGMMFFLPLTGWMMSSAAGFPVSVYGFFTMPTIITPDKPLRHMFGEWHETGVVVFLVIVSLHVLAALLHHFYHKDNILKRMVLPARAGV